MILLITSRIFAIYLLVNCMKLIFIIALNRFLSLIILDSMFLKFDLCVCVCVCV